MADVSIWNRIGNAFWGGDAGLTAEPYDLTEEAGIADSDIAKAASPTKTIGSNGVGSYGDLNGYVATGPLDNPRLFGERRYETFDKMVRDTSIVAAGVRLFMNLLANADWTVNPAEDQEENPQAQEIADTVYDILFDMTSSWSSVVRKTAMYRFYGFAVLEWTAKRRDDGSIGFLDIENRPQSTIARWITDPSGTVTDIVQRKSLGLQGEAILPRGKVVYAVDNTLTDNPEGLGLFRNLAVTAERLREFLELEKTGFTTDLRGIPVATAPLNELKAEVDKARETGNPATIKDAQATRTAMLKPLKEFLDNHVRTRKSGFMISSDTYKSQGADSTIATAAKKWSVDLLQGQASSFADMANAINRMNGEMARIMGVEHLLLGADGAGSLALAQSKVGLLHLTANSTLLDLVEVYERDVLHPLCEMNGWPPELWPSLGVGEIRQQDAEQVARVLADLATAGAPLTGSDPIVGELYDEMGYTRTPADDLAERDAALIANRNDPTDPTDPVTNPEDDVAKRRIIKSQRSRARIRRASARMRKAA